MSNVDFNDLKNQILIEHNKIREDPRSYIPYVEEKMKMLKGNVLHRPRDTPIETKEGAAGFEEAIEFLKKQRPVESLIFDERLSLASQTHAEELGKNGKTTHLSESDKLISERLDDFCEWEGFCSETLDFGYKKGRDIIISLLVDDGCAIRSQRNNLFYPDCKCLGIGTTVHKVFETVTVILYTGGVRDKGKPYFDPETYKYKFPEDVPSALDADETQSKKKEVTLTNSFQLADRDAPSNTISEKTIKGLNLYENKVRRTVKKVFTLEEGKKHIVEIEDIWKYKY